MRVLVTRPEPAARLTAEKLKALGHDPLVLPFFTSHHLPECARSALSEPASGLIVTSAEAARVLLPLRAAVLPYLQKPLYAVGEATAKAARAIGFHDVRVSGGSGATLAELIAGEAPTIGPLLYLAGEPRSPALEEGLARRGVAFRSVIIYRMVPVAYSHDELEKLAEHGSPCAVLLYSREAALRFASVLEAHPSLASAITSCLCLSPFISMALPASLQVKALAAEQPSEERLLALLHRA